jgi:hypothetical protein
MQEAEEASMDPWSLFLYGMKAPMTKEKYRGRSYSTALNPKYKSFKFFLNFSFDPVKEKLQWHSNSESFTYALVIILCSFIR